VAGAGFLVGERHILTCAHVIAQALGLADDVRDSPSATVSLDFPQIAVHTLFTARVIFWDPVRDDGRGDIAGLELLDEPPVGSEAVYFAQADQVWDHSFRVLGFPNGFDNGVWATGRLLGRQGTNWIQIEDIKIPGFAVISGFSGAPVWDTQLHSVVGMIVAASQSITAKTAFVIPSDVLVAAWPELTSLMRPPVPRNPYKGLHAFTEQDTRDFFGRETLINELSAAVETALSSEQKEGQQARLLTVLGASGSGKSSVVMAGLLPCLREGEVFNSEEWVYLDPVFPGTHPLETLAVSFAKRLPARGAVSIHDDLKLASERTLHLLASELAAFSQRKVVLIVDQFEEVFTLTTNETEWRHFFELLVTGVIETRGPLFVLLTLRADFYDRPMDYPDLYRLIDNHHISMLPLERDDLRRVIEQPANLPEVQLTFESGLVDQLLFDMQVQSGALPLLEFTLDQLFRRRSGYQLTLSAYREMGGVKGALAQHAEETYQALPSDEHRQAARDIFLRLIEPGTTEQDTTRHRAARSEFERADPVQAQKMRETLEAFIGARLLTTNQIVGKSTVEVSHEALIREWKRLAEWLRDARDDILFQQSLSEDVVEWEQRKRPVDRLYRGSQLKEAQDWAKRNMPNKHEGAFLRASKFQQTVSIMWRVTASCLLVLFIGGAAWFATHLPPATPDPTLITNLKDNGLGSLRWCIASANAGSTIKFAPNVRGTIKLTSNNISIDKKLAIQGPGASLLAISSTGPSIHMSPSATVIISGLSFKDGTFTNVGFIVNEGNLTVTNSTFLNNSSPDGGGAIFSESVNNITVTNSIFSNNSTELGGGAIFNNTSNLTVTNSIFSNNSSQYSDLGGGAILSYSNLTVTNITFLNNQTQGNGGAIDLEDQADPISFLFCTFYGNRSSLKGGALFIGPKAHSVTLTNSIVAANQAPTGPNIAGTLTTGGYNLIQGFVTTTFLDPNGLHATDKEVKLLPDLKIDSHLSNNDKQTQTLTNGGLTQTLKLQRGSPVIDVIPFAACHVTIRDASGLNIAITTDQLNDPRPDEFGDKCDIGAYESSY
jgi:predicted outer membrane repeat protein